MERHCGALYLSFYRHIRGWTVSFFSEDLDHTNGLIQVNSYLQSMQWDNLFVVGDANRFVDKKDLKNGRAAELQAKVAVENIDTLLKGEADLKEYKDSYSEFMELGTDGGMFTIKYPKFELGETKVEWAIDGTIPHFMKVAFEKYYLWKMS